MFIKLIAAAPARQVLQNLHTMPLRANNVEGNVGRIAPFNRFAEDYGISRAEIACTDAVLDISKISDESQQKGWRAEARRKAS